MDAEQELDLTTSARLTLVEHVLWSVVRGEVRVTNAGWTSTCGWLAHDEKQMVYDLHHTGMINSGATVRLTPAGEALARSVGVDVSDEATS